MSMGMLFALLLRLSTSTRYVACIHKLTPLSGKRFTRHVGAASSRLLIAFADYFGLESVVSAAKQYLELDNGIEGAPLSQSLQRQFS